MLVTASCSHDIIPTFKGNARQASRQKSYKQVSKQSCCIYIIMYNYAEPNSSIDKEFLYHVCFVCYDVFSLDEIFDCIFDGSEKVLQTTLYIFQHSMKYWGDVCTLYMQRIGYPRNVIALLLIIEQAGYEGTVGYFVAQDLLKALGTVAVPYYLAALLDQGKTDGDWDSTVVGICRILEEPSQRDSAFLCSSTLVFILSQCHPKEKYYLFEIIDVLSNVEPSSILFALPLLHEIVDRSADQKITEYVQPLIDLITHSNEGL